MFMPPCYDPVAKKDCDKRVLGCHDTCEKWAAYTKKRDEEYAERKKRNEIGLAMSDKKQKSYYKNLMRRRK